MQNEVDKQIAKLQDMVSVFRNAETVATSLGQKILELSKTVFK